MKNLKTVFEELKTELEDSKDVEEGLKNGAKKVGSKIGGAFKGVGNFLKSTATDRSHYK